MKIECLVTCSRYSDYLAHTLPLNIRHFNRMIVITDRQDKWTRDICEHYHVECLPTDAFFASERAFCKSGGINVGLAALACDDWVCHLDADIVLPPRTRHFLDRAELDPETIYGCDRIMCGSFEEWTQFCARPEIQHSCDIYVQANAFPLGVRIAKACEDGYVPIGFMQLFNPGATGRRTYPDHGTADRSDLAFARQWPRGKRGLLPEIIAIHLSAGDKEMGQNWRGRRSEPFGPEPLKLRQDKSDYGGVSS